MEQITLDTKITVRQAYMIMFAYWDNYWRTHNQPDAIGDALGGLQLWDTANGGKEPMDPSVFQEWLKFATSVLQEEQGPEGYRGADIQLTR